MRKIVIGYILLFGFSAYGLELSEAVDQTIKTNPTIQERLSNFHAVLEDVQNAKAAYLPSLDLKAGIGQEQVQSPFTANEMATYDVQDHALTLSYNLFNGLADKHRISQQEARLKAAAYSYMENVDDILLQLIEHYTNILRHKELIVVEKDNIKMDEKIYDNMLVKQKQGLQRLSDLKEARSKLALAYTNHLSEENNVQDVLINFHKVFGRYVRLRDITVPQFHEQLPNTIEEITKLAILNNPSIKVAKYEKMASMNDYKATIAPYLPKIDLELSGAYSENLSGIAGSNTDIRGMVYLNYNLFNGVADKSYRQKKVSTLHQKNDEVEKVKRDVIEAIQLSWSAFRITSRQMVFTKWYVQSSKDKLNSYYREFNLGRRSLIDLLGASDDFNNARRKKINTKYDLMFARYRLLDAMGELADALGVDVRSRVGLRFDKKVVATVKDTMPLVEDRDGDSIEDVKDMCSNSENNNSDLSHYGCEDTIRSNNSGFKALESFLNESIKDFVKETDEIEGWED